MEEVRSAITNANRKFRSDNNLTTHMLYIWYGKPSIECDFGAQTFVDDRKLIDLSCQVVETVFIGVIDDERCQKPLVRSQKILLLPKNVLVFYNQVNLSTKSSFSIFSSK